MRALYLYFAETANPDRRSSATENTPRVDDGPLTPIEPGAFSRWMASREREANAARVRNVTRGPVDTRAHRRSGPERAAAR